VRTLTERRIDADPQAILGVEIVEREAQVA